MDFLTLNFCMQFATLTSYFASIRSFCEDQKYKIYDSVFKLVEKVLLLKSLMNVVLFCCAKVIIIIIIIVYFLPI